MEYSPAQQFSYRSFLPREVCTFWGMRTMAMTRIEVKSQLGDDVVSREHGQRMRILIEEAIALGLLPVVVDFTGMQITSVSFFDESFGMLAKLYGEDGLLTKVKIEGIDPFDSALVRDIISSRSREIKKKQLGKQPARKTA
jgi:hypothetical protein